MMMTKISNMNVNDEKRANVAKIHLRGESVCERERGLARIFYCLLPLVVTPLPPSHTKKFNCSSLLRSSLFHTSERNTTYV